MKRYIEIVLFLLINLVSSSSLLILSLIIFVSLIFMPCGIHLTLSAKDINYRTFLKILIILLPILWVIKLNLLDFFYTKTKSFDFVKSFLHKFLIDYSVQKKTLMSAILLDILAFFMPYGLIKLLGLTDSGITSLKDFIGIGIFALILTCGGILPSYLSFLLKKSQTPISESFEKTGHNLKNFQFQILDYTTIIVVFFSAPMIYQAICCDFLPHYKCALFLLIPVFSFVFINIIAKIFKWQKAIIDVFSLVLLVITFLYLVIVEIYLLVGLQLFSNGPIKPPMSRYEVSIKKLKNKEWKHGLDHFPVKLPQNIRNYYLQVETSFDGYDTHYVKFDTNKTYIDSVLKQNDCKIRTTKTKIDSYDINFYISELKEADEICILHKSTQEKVYTSGISVYNNTNTIYFFYSNF